jgi:hypothetical protein
VGKRNENERIFSKNVGQLTTYFPTLGSQLVVVVDVEKKKERKFRKDLTNCQSYRDSYRPVVEKAGRVTVKQRINTKQQLKRKNLQDVS